ncbi:MAG: hypothetical protein KY475_10060 [Planctomycetes bacterium]|nr:hypothetical protein [Planctomycetota bacterium]
MTTATATSTSAATGAITADQHPLVDASRRVSAAIASGSKSLDWALLWKRVKFWAWNILTKVCVTIVYLALISAGLRYVLPDIGMRLSRLPGLSFLDAYTATYRLDLAHVFAVVPLVSAWLLWHWNWEIYLRSEAFDRRFGRWDIDRVKRVVVTMGAIIIAGDACLFGAAFMLASWGGGSNFSAAAVFATFVYVTVLGFVTFVSMGLGQAIEDHQREHLPPSEN